MLKSTLLKNSTTLFFRVCLGKININGQFFFTGLFLSTITKRLAKLERKDFPGGLAKRVRMGRIVVKGLFDFRRGLGS